MRLFITGATGLIGRRLLLDRLQHGDQVAVLTRDPERAEGRFAASANPNIKIVGGDPTRPGPWQQAVGGCQAVVHLAGAGIADRRWTRSYKETIESSRVESTRHLVDAIRTATSPPALLVCGSAIGYYGETGAREIEEHEPAGTDFLSQVCLKWEKQAHRAEEGGTRVVTLRTGIVLDERGGALKQMLTPFRLFAGGPISHGRQYMSWIHWRDLVGLVDLAIRDRSVRGPLNGTAPNPVTNRRFSHTLGRTIGRPSWLPVPRFGLRLALGEFADFLVMSQRVVPAKALAHGYRFVHPELVQALESLVAPSDRPHAVHATVQVEGGIRVNRPPTATIRLIAIGVDGTLLRSDNRLPQGTIEACRAAAHRGCAVVLATGRPPRATRSIVQALDIAAPTINCNGALIWNPQENRPQFHEPIPAETAQRVVELIRSHCPEVSVGLEVLDRFYLDRRRAELEQLGARLIEPDHVGPIDGYLTAPVTMVNLIGLPAELDHAARVLRDEYGGRRVVSAARPDPRVIQVTSAMADKGIALQRIARRKGLSREEIMTIGDGANDLGMIECAGFGVAMANAAPALQRLAAAVVPSNDDLGVAKAIHRFVLTGAPAAATAPPQTAGDPR